MEEKDISSLRDMSTARRSTRRGAKKRALVIVNPHAASVSSRLKNLVMYALQGRYEVQAVDTEAKNDATLIGFEVRNARYDVVVAFGGDGTFNEVVNAFAGTDVPVTVLPGGSVNVACRALGIPTDIIDATEHLLSLPDDWRPRQVDLGKAGGRRFFSSCGAGIDATVIEHMDDHPRIRSKLGLYYVGWTAVSAYYRSYLNNPIRMQIQAEDGGEHQGISAIAQNLDTFTYLGERPLRVCRNIAIDDGALAIGVLGQAGQRDLATLIARLLTGRQPMSRHSQVMQLDRVRTATVASMSEDGNGTARPFPVQVDGEYVGMKTTMEVRVEPGGLTVVA